MRLTRIGSPRRRSWRTWLLWGAGLALLLVTPFALLDPGVWLLAVDPELLAVIVLSSFALVRSNAAALFARAVVSTHRVR